MQKTRVFKFFFLVLFVLISAWLCFLLLPPISQSFSNHQFADDREFFYLPNALNVLSNLFFVCFGIGGLLLILLRPVKETSPSEKSLWICFFISSILIGIASGYYHIQPDNFGLALDRIALSLSLAFILSIMLCERVSIKSGMICYPFLLLWGIGSVIYWAVTESHGQGDLRLFGLFQFDAVLLILLILILFPSKYSGSGYLYVAVICYIIAKACEVLDRPIYEMLDRTLSGHTLKHFFAACVVLFMIFYLSCRISNHASSTNNIEADR